MTNRFRRAGTSKAQGQFCSAWVWGGGDTRIVWSVSDREALRNEGLAGGRRGGGMSRIWKQGLLGVPAAYQHPPDCRRWYPPVLGLTSSFPITCRCLGLISSEGKEQESVHAVNHAGRAACKIDAAACKLLNYISLPACMNLLMRLRRSVYSPVFVRGCLTALHSWCCGRWRGVCLSPLSDIGDDWNINGLRRAEHKRCPGRFIQQSRGCDAAKSECEWSQTVLSVMFKPAEPSLVFLFEHLSSDYFFSSSLEKD